MTANEKLAALWCFNMTRREQREWLKRAGTKLPLVAWEFYKAQDGPDGPWFWQTIINLIESQAG